MGVADEETKTGVEVLRNDAYKATRQARVSAKGLASISRRVSRRC